MDHPVLRRHRNPISGAAERLTGDRHVGRRGDDGPRRAKRRGRRGERRGRRRNGLRRPHTDLYDPSGIVIGLFTTALTVAQTAAIVPLAWAGDRYDKRAVLLGSLGLAGVVYAGFALVGVGLFVAPDTTTVPGFPFRDLALNRRIITMTGFRAQYAVAVTLVRTWVPIFAGVSANGGLAYGAVAVSLVITAEKFTNMLAQPFTPLVGDALGLPGTFPVLGPLSPAFLPLLALNALLGVADSVLEPASMALFADEGADGDGVASSFGIRELVWRPGSVLAPLAGGVLTTGAGIEWVFYLGTGAAFSGVLVFLAALGRAHGTDALRAW